MSFGYGFGLPSWQTQASGFTPASLFTGGEAGFWYDPTDIPLAWRRNLLTYTEQFDNAAWTKRGTATITPNDAIAPDGTLTADRLSGLDSGSNDLFNTSYIAVAITSSAVTYTPSIYIKRISTSGIFFIANPTNTTLGQWNIDLSLLPDAWVRITATTPGVTVVNPFVTTSGGLGGILIRALTVGPLSMHIWGAQQELGSTASTYQQIVTPEISFLQYQSQPVLYTDSAGTTPVTAVEQAVGLMLDKSKGLVLGPELAPNVPTNGAWSSVQAGWTVGGGLISVNSSVAGSTYIRNGTSVAGSAYQITFTVASFTSGTGVSAAAGTALGSFVTAPGTYTQIVFANSTAGVGVYAAGSSTVATISNVSAKLLPGNHAFQTTSAKRPVLRARYNLLTYSEQFDNAVWSKSSGGTGVAPTVTANAGVAPDGTNTAERVQFNCVGSTISDRSWITQSATIANASSYTGTVYVKAFDVANVGRQLRFVVESVTSAQVITLTSDWQRVTLTGTSSATTGSLLIETRGTVTNSATADALLWGADLRPTSQATGLIGPTYQRIAAATDYDVVGYLSYLAFDGVDDALTTNSIDFATVTSDGQARRNLLTFPTQFDDPAWSKAGVSPPVVTANQTTAPDGTNTADRAVYTSPTAGSRIEQSFTFVATTYTFSCYAKSNTGTTQTIALYKFDGTLETNSGNLSVGTDWVRLSWTFSAAAGAGSVNIRAGSALANVDVFLWGAQLETGSTATAFQNIGTDKMTVFAGVRKLSDAADAVLTELSASSSANNGSFLIAAPWDNPTPSRYLFRNRGTNLVSAATTDAAYTAPVTNVVSAIGDISGDVATLRVNGTQAGTTSSDQGTGNYGNYPLFIGARNQTSLYYNGWLTQLIGVGASVASGQISATEQWVGVRTGVQI